MKSKIQAILLFCFVVYSCGRDKNVKNEYNSDGTLKKKIVYTSPDKTDYREYIYAKDNQLEEIQEFADGVKNGRNFAYYPNGNIKSVYYYEMGRLTSIGRYYNDRGQITDKGLFINDSLVAKEEYFYEGIITRVNAFSKLNGSFGEAGNLLLKMAGNADLYGQDNSYFYIVHSADSISVGDSLKVDLKFIGAGNSDHMSLSLGSFDENLVFKQERSIDSDSLSLSFYLHPKRKGYNLILGKLSLRSADPKRLYTDFLFYHDFLTY
jgi:hypothetical protein